MARKGREFEELITTLEKALCGTGIKITSPDYIEDKTTKKTKREVDISLRGNIGSNEMLVIIECRNHKQKQDIKWIEQIATKRDDTNANKAIAVSSSGFTEAAKDKALAKNIELRTLEELNVEEIFEWFQVTDLTVYCLRWDRVKANIAPHKSLDSLQNEALQNLIKSFSGNFRTDTKFIIDPVIEDVLSIDDCISRNSDKIIEDLKPTSEKMNIKLKFIPQNLEVGFFVSAFERPIRIEYIELELQIWLEVKKAGIVSPSSYKNKNTSFTQIIPFEDIEIGGVRKSFKVHLMMKDGKQRLEFFGKDID